MFIIISGSCIMASDHLYTYTTVHLGPLQIPHCLSHTHATTQCTILFKLYILSIHSILQITIYSLHHCIHHIHLYTQNCTLTHYYTYVLYIIVHRYTCIYCISLTYDCTYISFYFISYTYLVTTKELTFHCFKTQSKEEKSDCVITKSSGLC